MVNPHEIIVRVWFLKGVVLRARCHWVGKRPTITSHKRKPPITIDVCDLSQPRNLRIFRRGGAVSPPILHNSALFPVGAGVPDRPWVERQHSLSLPLRGRWIFAKQKDGGSFFGMSRAPSPTDSNVGEASIRHINVNRRHISRLRFIATTKPKDFP